MSALAARATEPHPTRPSGSVRQTGALERSRDICPLLRSRDGSWSSVHASRDLRCWAVQPAAQPTLAKQRQLCASSAHLDCATYSAASAADPAVPPDDAAGTLLWPAGSPVPVALEAPRGRAGVTVSSPRAGGQALLVALMLVAFVVLAIAKTVPLTADRAGLSLAPTPSPAASALAAVSATPAQVSSSPAPATPVPSPSAPSAASPTPSPVASPRTYRVRAGDTLAMIAGKFRSTVKAIAAANSIIDARTIHPGQVLIIP